MMTMMMMTMMVMTPTIMMTKMMILTTSQIISFRENCTLKDNQLAERGREVAALKADLAKEEKEMEELDKRTTLEIREKKKIAELESDISEKHQTIEKLTSDKNGLLNEVESLKSSLSQQG